MLKDRSRAGSHFTLFLSVLFHDAFASLLCTSTVDFCFPPSQVLCLSLVLAVFSLVAEVVDPRTISL